MNVIITYHDGTCDSAEIDIEGQDWTKVSEEVSQRPFLTTKSGVFRVDAIRSVVPLADD